MSGRDDLRDEEARQRRRGEPLDQQGDPVTLPTIPPYPVDALPDAAQELIRDIAVPPWSEAAYQSWRRRSFDRGAKGAGVDHARPYDLRHSFASLLLHEGRSVIYVARQLGHGAQLTLHTYGHVIDELEDTPRQDAEDAIRAARESVSGKCPPTQLAEGWR